MRLRIGPLQSVLARLPLPEGNVVLSVAASREEYAFSLRREDGTYAALSRTETRYLSTEVAGGFTGVFLGMYTTGNGRAALVPADFDWFEYRPDR